MSSTIDRDDELLVIEVPQQRDPRAISFANLSAFEEWLDEHYGSRQLSSGSASGTISLITTTSRRCKRCKSTRTKCARGSRSCCDLRLRQPRHERCDRYSKRVSPSASRRDQDRERDSQ